MCVCGADEVNAHGILTRKLTSLYVAFPLHFVVFSFPKLDPGSWHESRNSSGLTRKKERERTVGERRESAHDSPSLKSTERKVIVRHPAPNRKFLCDTVVRALVRGAAVYGAVALCAVRHY